jgi:hypothetical protein
VILNIKINYKLYSPKESVLHTGVHTVWLFKQQEPPVR